ncbi:MAG TPA: DUF2007 domain-containing protein [Ignavibacteria bacterium]|nr:DUF2007 domain-containing protein [Ignavibacteria bacterium]
MTDEELQNEEQQEEEYDGDEHKKEDFENLVTVLSTKDEGIAAVAKSILEEAEIQYYVKGEGAQSLYGVGVIGVGGFSTEAEPIEIQVIQEDADAAIELLKDVEASKPVDDTGLFTEDSNEDISEGENTDDEDK